MVGGLTKKTQEKLRLDPATDGSRALKTAGAFTQNAIMDFTSKVRRDDASEDDPTILTVHSSQPFPKGITVGTLFADGTAGIAIKVGGTAYRTFSIPLHIREILHKLDREAGLVPLGAESRITDTQVTGCLFIS